MRQHINQLFAKETGDHGLVNERARDKTQAVAS